MGAHWTTRTKIQHRLRRLAERETFAAWPVADVTAWFASDYVPWRTLELGRFTPIPPNTDWGANGTKGYFRLRFAIPPALDGQAVRLIPDMGGEGLCYREGEPWQSVDWAHPEVDLGDAVRAGEAFDLVVEARPTRTYWGFGFPPGQPTEPAATTIRLGMPRLVAVNRPVRALARAGRLLGELAEQLLESATTATPLGQLREQFYYELKSPVPGGSPRGERILRQLDEALDRIDLLADDDTLATQATAAMASLQTTLGQVGAPGRFTVNASPNSHLDVAWVWTMEETQRKSARTLTSTLRLLAKYPHYTFMQTSPLLLDMVRANFPTLFGKVRAAVATGRLEIAGSMWVEPDLNLAGGESLVRQLLIGGLFLRDELGGVGCRVAYIPDAFGDTGALPQILALAGIPYFMTVKINTNDRSHFPHAWFWWEGIDGSRVLAHQPPSLLDGPLAPAMLLDAERRFPQHGHVDLTIRPWGLSDGGGGPTEEDVERLAVAADLDGLPLVTAQRADACFDRVAAEGADLPVWRGEMYFERHRGTYTTHALLKRLYRRVEASLYEAELLAAITGTREPGRLREQWRLLCTHENHDVITGNSVAEVTERAVADLGGLLDTLEADIATRLQAIAGGGDDVLVWNPSSWERTDAVALPRGIAAGGWTTPDGRPVAVQETADGSIALVPGVPSVGYLRLRTSDDEGLASSGALGPLRWDENDLEGENGLVRVRLNRAGQVMSLLDLRSGREVIAGGTVGNELRLHVDIPAPGLYGPLDSVEIGEFYQDTYITLEAADVVLVERGPVRLAWRATYETGRSRIVQDIRLYAHSARLEFSTQVDWNESERLLRVYFPVAINAEAATHEIQFGAIRRPTHDNTSWDQAQFEVPAHRWVDMSEDGYGVALLNDGKYGCSAKHGVLGLSLLRATLWPNPDAERRHHRFSYAVYPHDGGYQAGGVVQEAIALNLGMRAVQAGAGPGSHSFLSISQPNVILSALKPAEDGVGSVLRVYEAYNRRGDVRIQGPFTEAWSATLLEDTLDAVPVEASSFGFAVRPMGIHTFRIRRG